MKTDQLPEPNRAAQRAMLRYAMWLMEKNANKAKQKKFHWVANCAPVVRPS